MLELTEELPAVADAAPVARQAIREAVGELLGRNGNCVWFELDRHPA